MQAQEKKEEVQADKMSRGFGQDSGCAVNEKQNRLIK